MGSSSIHQLYTTYADDVPKSAFVANYGYPHVQAIISANMRKQYEELTENSTSIWDTYDYEITVDSRHQSYYSSYLWVNSEGKLMEKIIIYPNDRVIIGKRKYFNLIFEPLVEVVLNTESIEACEEYQELFKEFLAE